LRAIWSNIVPSIVRREKYERTAFGKLIKWAFIAFNVLMIIWIVSGLSAISNMQVHSTAERAGQVIGSAIGISWLLSLWAAGDIILGILVAFTRGDKVITEEAVGGFAFCRRTSRRKLRQRRCADRPVQSPERSDRCATFVVLDPDKNGWDIWQTQLTLQG
jgi:hypothetical protein